MSTVASTADAVEADRTAPAGTATLSVRDLRVRFGAFTAVDGVDLDLVSDAVHFLIGPNGAGKTTCVDAITGLAKATGSVTLQGQELLGVPVRKLARMGIGRTFQTATLFENLTVLQNLDISAGMHRSPWSLLGARSRIDPAIDEALETTGLGHVVDRPAGTLSHGQKQWVEIAMLLVQRARVLLLDEPVAGMSHDEREATGQLLHRLKRDRTVIVVEHDMDFMRQFASEVTVLHQGRVLAAGSVETVTSNAQVQAVYLGTAPEPDATGQDHRPAEETA